MISIKANVKITQRVFTWTCSLGILTIAVVLVSVTEVNSQLLPSFQNIIDRVSRVSPAIKELELGSLFPSMPFYDKDVNNVKFYLAKSKKHKAEEQLVVNDSASVKASRFDPRQKVKILIHGWSQTAKSRDFPGILKDAYLEWGKVDDGTQGVNIILVDWSALSREFLYYNSALYTEKVGRRLGEFIVFLKLGGFIPSYQNIHIIGFSLGAQVAGVAGNFVSRATGGDEKVGRITGLDPAGPIFSSDSLPLNRRLDESDASYVDVIHTNMGILMLGEFGTPLVAAHADFFPNGGNRQPGCELSLLTEYSVPRKSSCHHIKAIDYFKRSIEGKLYVACKCSDWTTFLRGDCFCDEPENRAFMGEQSSPVTRGKYYLYAK